MKEHQLGILQSRLQQQIEYSNSHPIPRLHDQFTYFPTQKLHPRNKLSCMIFGGLSLVFYTLLISYIVIHDGFTQLGRWNKGVDQDGNLCGYSNAIQYPYIYQSNPTELYLQQRICVTQCPTLNNQTLSCYGKQQCVQSINLFDQSTTFQIYPTIQYLYSVCVPTIPSYFQESENAYISSTLNIVLSDCWTIKYICLLLFIINTIFQYILNNKKQGYNLTSNLSILVFIITILLIIAAGGIYYIQLYTNLTVEQNQQELPIGLTLTSSSIKKMTVKTNTTVCLIIGVGCIVVFFIGFIVLIYQYKQIMVIQFLSESFDKVFYNDQFVKIPPTINLIKLILLIGNVILMFALLAFGTNDANQLALQSQTLSGIQITITLMFILLIYLQIQVINTCQYFVLITSSFIINYQPRYHYLQQLDPLREALIRLQFDVGSAVLATLYTLYGDVYSLGQWLYCKLSTIFKQESIQYYGSYLNAAAYIEMVVSGDEFVSAIRKYQKFQTNQRRFTYQDIGFASSLFSIIVKLSFALLNGLIMYLIVQIEYYQDRLYSNYPAISAGMMIGLIVNDTYTQILDGAAVTAANICMREYDQQIYQQQHLKNSEMKLHDSQILAIYSKRVINKAMMEESSDRDRQQQL